MIPDPKNPLPSPTSIILDVLSKTPRLTIKELHRAYLNRSEQLMSLQGFYKLFSQLQRQRILVKDGKLVSIDAGWVHAVKAFSLQLESTYLQPNPSTANILVEEGRSNEFEFPSVIRMDDFWYHALVTVAHFYRNHEHPDKNAYNYNHHCWFQVVRSNSEQSLGDTYASLGMDWIIVSGSDTFIDQLVESMVKGKGLRFAISKPPAFKDNQYIVVVGDFIFETQLPLYIYELFEDVYSSVISITDAGLQKLEDFIRLPAKTTLKISRDAVRAKALRSQILVCL